MKRWVIYRKNSGTILRVLHSNDVPTVSSALSYLMVPEGISVLSNEKIDSVMIKMKYEPISENIDQKRSEEIEWSEI